MKDETLNKVIKNIKEGKLTVNSAREKLKKMLYMDLGYAKVDHHRIIRKGFPEVIYAKDKTVKQIAEISKSIYTAHKIVLVTRITPVKYSRIRKKIPATHSYNESAEILRIGRLPRKKSPNTVPILTGGTSDICVAEEASETLQAMGNSVKKIYDVGVSGVHRLMDQLDNIKDSRVVIVIAGMDGVLPTIVAGLVRQPVIAVPTSSGYGVSFAGIGPLITMLNSCAPGVSVVNIDNGFGAGFTASLINQI